MPRALPLLPLAALLAAGLLTGGCVFWAPSLDPIRQEIERRQPGTRLDPQIQLRLGRLSMALARSITRAAADDDPESTEIARLLRHVKGVEVAVYEVERMSGGDRARWNRQLAELGGRRGWRTAAKIDDEGTLGTVLYKEKGGSIRSVYVFALDDESLVLARFRGHLDRAIADAIALRGRKVPDAVVRGSVGNGDRQPGTGAETAAAGGPAVAAAAGDAAGSAPPH